MALLGEGPFRVVAPLITKIHDQALRAETGNPNGTDGGAAQPATGLAPAAKTEAPLVQN